MSVLDYTPDLSNDEAKQIAVQHFGIEPTHVKSLPSERDQNFRLTTGDGQTFVLKISNGTEPRALLEAQTAMITHIAQHVNVVAAPMVARDGRTIVETTGRDLNHLVRLVPYLEGIPLAAFGYRRKECLADLGRRTGQLRKALADFDHAALHRDFSWDLAAAPSAVGQRLDRVGDEALRRDIQCVAGRFEQHAAPVVDSLPKSVIHSDLNDGNVIIQSGRVAGVIDFGDAVHSWSVGEIAVAIAYAVLGQTDPLSLAATMVAAHHTESPLREDEIESLFGLICMRLCLSVVMAAEQQQQRPDDRYLSVSQEPIRRTLPLLRRIPYKIATTAFRQACGMAPVDPQVTTWLAAQQGSFTFPLVTDSVAPSFAVLDCSVASSWLPSDVKGMSGSSMSQIVCDELAAQAADISVGRYLEPRIVYTSGQFAAEIPGAEDRTIHLGIDLFAPAGATVVAPLAGVVECVVKIDLPLDYGNLVILRHQPSENIRFFTLYGHLADETAKSISVGQTVRAGEPLGELGNEQENGGWSPHLHFQIMLDLLDYENDFPGVCVASQKHAWASLCPHPNLMLALPAQLDVTWARDKSQTLTARRQHIGPSLSIGYESPLEIVRGWKHWLYDETGRRYLDAYNNVPHVGHCHPQVVAALTKQAALLNTNTRYLGNPLNEYARRLASTLPAALQICYFLNSASEANELALRLARAFTGHKDLVVLDGAYHGHTTTLIDISPYKHAGLGGEGSVDWVHTASVPDTYRGPFRDPQHAGSAYAAAVNEIVEGLTLARRGVCGFIAESCPSVAGQIMLPTGYLPEVYRSVRAAGGVCIADEVQTAYGRLGAAFYGFELQHVVPDIIVLGKPIGNGHPLAAIVTTREIAHAFDNGMEFFSTFGGNNVSCAVGIAVLDALQSENLQARAIETGQYLIRELKQLASRHALIGDVRGSGLFLGIELVRDRESLEPAAEEASFVVNRMRELGVLVGTDGLLHNVIKIRPPMTFGIPEAKLLLAALERALQMMPPTVE